MYKTLFNQQKQSEEFVFQLIIILFNHNKNYIA